MTELYAIAHRNGTGGVFSSWYIDERDIPTLEEARKKRKQFREEHPASNGWYADVAILTDNGNGEPLPEGSAGD